MSTNQPTAVGDAPEMTSAACTQCGAFVQRTSERAPDVLLPTLLPRRRGTLADLDFSPPGPQLVHPFLAPDGVTVLYGRGGVGKGMLSTYFARELVRAGIPVMIIDYETHPREWASRSRSMGFTDEELRSVLYRSPYGTDWAGKRGPLLEVSGVLHKECADFGVGYVIIDSYVTATSSGDAMGGAPGAAEFYEGFQRVGVAAGLVIAHVAGSSDRFPERPFGSVFVHNLARETWAVEPAQSDQGYNPDPPGTTFLSLELRNMKKNDGPKSKPQFVTFSFLADESIDINRHVSSRSRRVDQAVEILRRADRPMSTQEIVAAIKAETGGVIAPDTIRKALQRDPQRVGTTDTPRRWVLKSDAP